MPLSQSPDWQNIRNGLRHVTDSKIGILSSFSGHMIPNRKCPIAAQLSHQNKTVNNMFRTLLLFFTLMAAVCKAVPPPQQKNIPELPQGWLDTWNIGLTDQVLTISSTAISIDNVDLFVLEAQTFLNEVSIITADGVKRCNKCHVVTELHANILSMHTSDCLSQVL